MHPEDKDPIETSEWLDAINSVIEEEGVDRASFLMTKLAKRLNEEGAIPTYNLTTPFRNSIPLKRGGTPEDVANTTLFLASDLSAYITGQTLHVCGGMLT